MATYNIESAENGIDLGDYAGATAEEALLAHLKDIGYGSSVVWWDEAKGDLAHASDDYEQMIGHRADYIIRPVVRSIEAAIENAQANGWQVVSDEYSAEWLADKVSHEEDGGSHRIWDDMLVTGDGYAGDGTEAVSAVAEVVEDVDGEPIRKGDVLVWGEGRGFVLRPARGGVREGAGRPAAGEEPRNVQTTFRVTPSAAAALTALGQGVESRNVVARRLMEERLAQIMDPAPRYSGANTAFGLRVRIRQRQGSFFVDVVQDGANAGTFECWEIPSGEAYSAEWDNAGGGKGAYTPAPWWPTLDELVAVLVAKYAATVQCNISEETRGHLRYTSFGGDLSARRDDSAIITKPYIGD